MTADSQIMNYVVRMVVPMRREFGRSLDVQHFLHDLVYADQVLEEALRSQDPRLREYASYVQKTLHGPRTSAGSIPAGAKAHDAQETEKIARSTPPSENDDEAKTRILKRYTHGLR